MTIGLIIAAVFLFGGRIALEGLAEKYQFRAMVDGRHDCVSRGNGSPFYCGIQVDIRAARRNKKFDPSRARSAAGAGSSDSTKEKPGAREHAGRAQGTKGSKEGKTERFAR